MQRVCYFPVLFLVLSGLAVEPVLANKFQTISGGVSGMSGEKIALLKNISLYAGCFLIFLALLGLATRNRFEGFIGYSRRGSSSTVLRGVAVLTVSGALLIGMSFL